MILILLHKYQTTMINNRYIIASVYSLAEGWMIMTDDKRITLIPLTSSMSDRGYFFSEEYLLYQTP